MENVVAQLVDVSDCVEIVNKDLHVLEATEIAGESNRIDSLYHSFKREAHLIVEL